MARLTKKDREELRRLAGWVQSPEERSPDLVDSTVEARTRYAKFCTEYSKLFPPKPFVPFVGDSWKL